MLKLNNKNENKAKDKNRSGKGSIPFPRVDSCCGGSGEKASEVFSNSRFLLFNKITKTSKQIVLFFESNVGPGEIL